MTPVFDKNFVRAGMRGAMAVSLVLSATSAQAGFFDFFFQQPSRPASAPYYNDNAPFGEQAPVLRRAPPPHRRITLLKDHGDLSLPKGPHSDDILDDHTLRDGDAVMTDKGVRIYAGSSHGQKEFARLADTKGLSEQEKTQLNEINAHRNEDGTFVADAATNDGSQTAASNTKAEEGLATGRSSTGASIQAWRWVRDTKGTMVRYVGP